MTDKSVTDDFLNRMRHDFKIDHKHMNYVGMMDILDKLMEKVNAPSTKEDDEKNTTNN